MSANSLEYMPQIDALKCNGCGWCVKACPTQTLTMVDQLAVVAHPEQCRYHGLCEEVCPTQAISLPYEFVFGPE